MRVLVAFSMANLVFPSLPEGNLSERYYKDIAKEPTGDTSNRAGKMISVQNLDCKKTAYTSKQTLKITDLLTILNLKRVNEHVIQSKKCNSVLQIGPIDFFATLGCCSRMKRRTRTSNPFRNALIKSMPFWSAPESSVRSVVFSSTDFVFKFIRQASFM